MGLGDRIRELFQKQGKADRDEREQPREGSSSEDSTRTEASAESAPNPTVAAEEVD